MPAFLTAHTVNDTIIVPAGAPAVLRPDEADKLATAVWVLILPSVVATALLVFQGTRPYRYWWTYARLSALWTLSVAIVGLGVFARYRQFNHFTDFLAIAHVQIEWLIITLLLSGTPTQGVIASTIGGLIMYTALFAFPGIKGTFLVTSVIGGFGDTYMPVLLFYGKQWALALGGVGHFINAYVTFRNFVQWTPVSSYLTVQLFSATLHAVATVVGVRSNLIPAHRHRGVIALHDHHDVQGDSEEMEESKENPLSGVNITPKVAIKLGLFSLVLSLAASLPINLTPRP